MAQTSRTVTDGVVIDPSRVLGVSATARRIERSEPRVRQMIAEGKLTAIKTPIGRLITLDSVEAFERAREAS